MVRLLLWFLLRAIVMLPAQLLGARAAAQPGS
jgi:hypothetical protein